MAPDFTIPFFCEHTHHRVWDMKMHVLWMSSGLWWIFKARVTFWVQSLNRWASPKIHRCTCGIFLSEFASTLVFNYLIYWAFEVGSAFCLCWFVSCVHLHGVVIAHIHFFCLHRWFQKTTRPWLPWPRPSPRMSSLLTWMTMREGTKSFRLPNMWFQRPRCVFEVWMLVFRLIKS